MMKIRKASAVAAALALGLTAGIAQAAPQTVDLQWNSYSKGRVAAEGQDTGSDWSTSGAGEFKFDVVGFNDQGEPFPINVFEQLLAFCSELGFPLDTDNTVTYEIADPSEMFGSDVVSNISRLYTGFYASVTGSVSSAAFQLALWEIINEGGTDGLSLSTGTFTADLDVSANLDAAIDLANNWLEDLSGLGASTRFLALTSEGSQDLVFIPVPEPGMLLLIGSGLLFGVGMRRRMQR